MERERLDSSYTRRSNAWGAWHTWWPIALLAIALVMASSVETVAGGLAMIVVIGLCQYRLYFPLHEASHYMLLDGRGANRAVGHVLAGLLATPFDAFRNEHMVHHREYGTSADPASVDYLVGFRSRKALFWFLSSPLVGGALWVKARENYAPLLRRLIGRGADAPSRRAPRSSAALSGVVAIVFAQAMQMWIVSPTLDDLWRYPVFVLLPGATVFLFLSRLRMFLEHAALEPGDAPEERILARTMTARTPDIWLLSGLGFRYHHEHHLYPSVPGRNLSRVHRERVDELAADEVSSNYATALSSLWSSLDRS